MTLCAAPRHGEDEAETETHAHLCKPCRLGLCGDLRRLPRLHAELDHVPARGDGDGSGLPFSEPASECRDQIRHDLTYWARHITGLRGLDAPPVMDHGSWSAYPVHAMAGWLAGQVTWCSFRDWAPDMAGAISADRARALALLDPWVTARIEPQGPDGLCPVCETSDPLLCEDCGEVFNGQHVFAAHFAIDDRGRAWCELPAVMGLARSPSGRWSSRVTVTVYKSDGDRRRSFIRCPRCAGVWEPEQWLSYGRRVVQRREAMAS